MVLVPCARPASDSDHAPVVSAVVVAFVALLEIADDASAVPVKMSVVEVETAPSADGAVMTGADGGVVSAATALDTGEDDEHESDEADDNPRLTISSDTLP